MDHQTVITLIEAVVLIVAFLLGKFVFPKVPTSTIETITAGFELIVKKADTLVAWAKQFLPDKTGEEKMDSVVKLLTELAANAGIKISETEIRGIVQKAYDEMKKGQLESEAKIAAATAPVVAITESLISKPSITTTQDTDKTEDNK